MVHLVRPHTAGVELVDVDATITIDHSDGKKNSASMLRAGNAGSNTDRRSHRGVAEALAALPRFGSFRARLSNPDEVEFEWAQQARRTG